MGTMMRTGGDENIDDFSWHRKIRKKGIFRNVCQVLTLTIGRAEGRGAILLRKKKSHRA